MLAKVMEQTAIANVLSGAMVVLCNSLLIVVCCETDRQYSTEID